jgi:hypothetical protein
MHDVFISYAHEDKSFADAACHAIEAVRYRCWIAPRDAVAGRSYAQSIIDAIGECRVIVLIYSRHSNASTMVLRELEVAASAGKALLPIRIDEAPPSSEMRFWVGREHWLDALTPPREAHIARLVAAVERLLGAPAHLADAAPRSPCPRGPGESPLWPQVPHQSAPPPYTPPLVPPADAYVGGAPRPPAPVGGRSKVVKSGAIAACGLITSVVTAILPTATHGRASWDEVGPWLGIFVVVTIVAGATFLRMLSTRAH